jgi:hypothetical protein
MNKHWTDEQFINAVKNSISVSEVLKIFNLPVTQPHYRKKFFSYVKKLNLNLEHFHHKYTEKDIQNILNIKNNPNTRLKTKLINSGVSDECSICGLTEWLGQKIILEVDHVDGDRGNNTLDNLRLLCPNCHSQTDTFRSKNIKTKTCLNFPAKKYFCLSCNKELFSGSRYCIKCFNSLERKTKIIWPSPEDLISKLKNGIGYVALAKELGVKDNSIKKYLKKAGYDPKIYTFYRINFPTTNSIFPLDSLPTLC